MSLRSLPLIMLLMVCSQLHGQRNLSFESTDSAGTTAGWKSTGNSSRLTAFYLGAYPFTSTDQSYFFSLRHDTVSAPPQQGTLTHTFPFADTPASIYFDAFYFPKFTYQRYSVEMFSTRWNGTTRDTLMRVIRDLGAVVDSNNNLKPAWTTQQLDLGSYSDTLIPDSSTIIIRLDAVAPMVNTTLLLIDHIHFGKWKTSLTENETQTISVSAWPNPASGLLSIKAVGARLKLTDLIVLDAAGRIVKSIRPEPGYELQIDISDLQAGIYFIGVKSGDQLKTLRIVVQH